MSESKVLAKSENQRTDHAWEEDQALELWKYFDGVGGADKNTMVTVVSLLLGFSATIIGYIVTQLVSFDPLVLAQPLKAIWLALLGFIISLLAAYMALLYGGYANRNWAKAAEIARSRDWRDLLPDSSMSEKGERANGQPGRLASFAERRARHHEPRTELAPVFSIFALLAVLAALLHLIFLIGAGVLILLPF